MTRYRRHRVYRDYRVGDDGSVWSRKSGVWVRLKSRPVNQYGHYALHLWLDGKRKTHLVHRLVLEAFVGPCPKGMEGCHNDNNPANNVLTNLRWDTHVNNMRDQVANGTSNVGERNGVSVLSEADVKEIRRDSRTQREIASSFGITQGAVSAIKTRRNWAWVPEEKSDE